MNDSLIREIKITLKDSSLLEYYLRVYGFNNFIIHYISKTQASVIFENEEDAIAFILRDIITKLTDNSDYYSSEAEFEFTIRLEKKLKTFSSANEYISKRMKKVT